LTKVHPSSEFKSVYNQNNFKDKKEGERAKQGDLVVFDYKATIDGKDFKGGEGKIITLIFLYLDL